MEDSLRLIHHTVVDSPLARDVIWPLQDDKLWVGPALESLQQTSPLSQIRLVLESELSDTLQHFL